MRRASWPGQWKKKNSISTMTRNMTKLFKSNDFKSYSRKNQRIPILRKSTVQMSRPVAMEMMGKAI